MRAESCLRKPGDAARRESDGAVAVRRLDVTAEGDALSGSCVFMQPKRQPDYYTPVNSIAGEDWQPLVTAERVEELEEKRCGCGLPMSRNPHPDAGKPEKLCEVGAMYECVSCTRRGLNSAWSRAVAAEHQVATLTAELEKARSGEAWVGERIQWGDIDAGELFLAEHTGEPRLQYCVKFSEVVADVCPNATAFYECHLPPVPRTEWRDGETVYFHGDSAMEPLIAWIDMIDRKLDQGRDGKTLSGEGRRLIKALKAIVASVAAEEAAPLPPAEPTPEEAGEEKPSNADLHNENEGCRPRTEREVYSRLVEKYRDLVCHCWVHSGHRDCGYDQMTHEQKAMFDACKGPPDEREPCPLSNEHEPTPTPAPAKPEWLAAVEVVAEERACMPGGESRDLYILAEAVLELAAAIEQE